MNALKPCPFCGSLALASRSFSEKTRCFFAFISCTKCGAKTRSFRSESDPLETWDHNEPAQRATAVWNARVKTEE